MTMLAAGFGLYHFCRAQTDGFSVAKLRSDETFTFRLKPQKCSLEPAILAQPYHYLGRGAQAFAFVSEDGKYVLKFFSHHKGRHILQKFSFLMPKQLSEKLAATMQRRQRRLHNDFVSYKLAEERLFDATGLLYAHLGKTTDLNTRVTLFDKIGVKLEVNLDDLEFVIQRKAELIYPSIEKWVEEGNHEKAKEALGELVALLKHRSRQGIYDKDPDLKTNFGFLETRPIQFDIGRFVINNEGSCELTKITQKLCTWLESFAPELSIHVQKCIEEESCEE